MCYASLEFATGFGGARGPHRGAVLWRTDIRSVHYRRIARENTELDRIETAMPTLVLLSVADEDTAREGFARILDLHAVALLTLQGCALLSGATGAASATGVAGVAGAAGVAGVAGAARRTVLIDGPPEAVGVQRVEVVNGFAPLVRSLLRVDPVAANASNADPDPRAADLDAAAASVNAGADVDADHDANHDHDHDHDAIADSALAHIADRNDVVALLGRGEPVLAFLVSAIAEGEVFRQLEFLRAERLQIELTDDAVEQLAVAS
ncbi:hypothetical protein [Glaciihabitans tibetensis]|uniref:hypothetical protein n=1 Tax=Glaciihabitans tibetensis TaxID=1266600 RepID=UPI000D05F1B1|nr:hypothetical protein [Glaciihabitans tibetensis]